MTTPPRILIATSNKGKLREIKSLLAGLRVELVGLEELGENPEFSEDGSSFEENARAKAIHYHRMHGLPTVADDSGLVIDALCGEPGVNSSRFLGADTPYPEKMATLLGRLDGLPETKRGARFTCALCLAAEGKAFALMTKHVFGRIADAPMGSGGFGYDPIFYCPEIGATFGEAPQELKDHFSHRAQAVGSLRALLATHRELASMLGLDIEAPNS